MAEALQERGQGDAWNACFTHRRNINTRSHTHANATQTHSDWTEPGKKKKEKKTQETNENCAIGLTATQKRGRRSVSSEQKRNNSLFSPRLLLAPTTGGVGGGRLRTRRADGKWERRGLKHNATHTRTHTLTRRQRSAVNPADWPTQQLCCSHQR